MIEEILRWTGEPGVVGALLALYWQVGWLTRRAELGERRLGNVEARGDAHQLRLARLELEHRRHHG